MEDTSSLENSENVNVLLMDGMGPLNDIINALPVKLLINFPTMNEEDELLFKISLYNPYGSITSNYSGFLDIWQKDFAPQLPIRKIKGKWKMEIKFTGFINKTMNYTLILQ